MKDCALEQNMYEQWMDTDTSIPDYYSVEFSISGLDYLYQFKIWKMEPRSMCVLIRKDSQVAGRLNVGDIIKMKYYTTDTVCPTKDLQTKIKYINTNEDGRFRGHCVVGLSVLETEGDRRLH